MSFFIYFHLVLELLLWATLWVQIYISRQVQTTETSYWLVSLPQEMRSPNIPSPMFHQQNCRRGKGLWVKKGEAIQTLSFSSSRLVPSRHWDESTLPPSWGFWGVIWGHSPGNRGQKLLPLLLHQTGCTDDLMSWRPQIRPVHFLS